MEQEEPPKSLWDDFLNTELADKLDSLGGEQQTDQPKTEPEQSQTTTESSPSGMVTIEFYQNNATMELVSLAYYAGYNTQIQQYRPNRVANRGAGFFNIPNVTDLEPFVKEYEAQLDFRGVRFHRLETKKIGDNEIGVLFMHDYGTTKGLDTELIGVLTHLEQKYKQP